MNDVSQMLLVSDYDRTMTAFSGEIPRSNLEAADRWMALGGAFTIATGRSRPMYNLPSRLVRVNAPVILANGAAFWDMERDELDVCCPFAPGALEAAWEIHLRFPGLRMEFEGLRGHDCFGRDPLREAYLQSYCVPTRYCAFEDAWTDVLSVTYYAPFRKGGYARFSEINPADEAPFDEIESLVRTNYELFFQPIRSLPRMIELIPRGCGKGKAARALAERMNRPLLLCAGDAPNDADLLAAGDRAFIPANAAPELFGLGYEEAASCDEGTIASILRQFL